MKVISITIILLVAGSLNLFAQWEPDFRLTNDPASSSTYSTLGNAKTIAANGNVLHVVWSDDRNGNNEIFYKRSTDWGQSWGPEIRQTNDGLHSVCPSVAVSGSMVHIVWKVHNAGTYNIFYKRSTDGGESWEDGKILSNLTGYSTNPSVAASGVDVHVAWFNYFIPWQNNWIYYKHSTDGGESWAPDTLLSSVNGYSILPSLAVSGSNVHMVWQDVNIRSIIYKSSTNGGETWGMSTRLTDYSGGSMRPSISVSGSFIHVAGESFRDGNFEIYYKRSTDGGTTWGADTLLTYNILHQFCPSISASGATVHIVWQDNRDDNYEIYYKRSLDNGADWEEEMRLTNNSASSINPSIAVLGTDVNVIWSDNRDGNDEIYYKRNPTGSIIGINNISSEIPDHFSLSQNYPNPFNPVTVIKYSLLADNYTTLKIYNILGNEITTLIDQIQNAGSYSVEFDGSNYVSGLYYYKLESGNFIGVKKMILVK
ncbi:MAG: T9SS type A sorting domain-containing protein [Ignavibacteriae bacterium]|nr:T9SS type A sorting domain-containing protein [Ignavibacteriota bacterium]